MPEENDIRPQLIQIRIKDLRREKSLTQEELADALGISRQSINAMEAGRTLPSLPVAMQIAAYFSVPLHTVFIIEQPNTITSFLPVPWSPLAPELRVITPAINLWEDETTVHVELRLPGYHQDDLELEVGEDFVTVGSDGHAHLEGRHYLRREFSCGPFERTIALPSLVHSDQADAQMRLGVLSIALPKIIQERPRSSRIQIKSAE